ncbi:uncharacterized protein BYT42DRAFT_564011 [Radiomyces spectabilis]|uniref:uncharacterized protein n=1 Tax=Radiomyces spectabilis TaxID=64574 RepID=UPI002220A71D|nr:uncharacterized protein BYT42DRAFT_564011 [Radiomyces spectabilis]KAI8384905.1 hypothetical protein BYT42DRAFT_564011 [Radiomyces spectabilis]
MGQTPSSTRHDNASTRTLHSSSMVSQRSGGFLRRLSQRLHAHPTTRRFARDQRPVPSSASVTSSVRRATVAATTAAVAATGPLGSAHGQTRYLSSDTGTPVPGMQGLHSPGRGAAAGGTNVSSSAASIVSAVSNASDMSHMLSEIISAAVLNALPQSNDSDRQSFFRYVQLPMRSPNSQTPPSSTTAPSLPSQQDEANPAHRMLPIFIVGYRSSTYDPPTAPSLRRPRSTVSTSSSLATLQSMPLSTYSSQQPPRSTHSAASTRESIQAPTNTNQWLIYVVSGQQAHPPWPLHDNPTYEELLWLSNVLGPARPPTTTQAAIDATLPVILWSDDSSQKYNEQCLVCLDQFAPKQAVRVLKCRHVFHMECVDRWLVEGHNSCPVCRGVPVQSTPSPAQAQ